MQFWQVLTKLKICLKWTPPLTFADILNPAAYLGKNSITDVYILKHNSNCFPIKRLYHRCLYSKARDLTLNGIRKILWTSTTAKIFSSICTTPIFFIKDYQNSNLRVFTSDQLMFTQLCIQHFTITLFRQPIFTSKTYNHAVTYNHVSALSVTSPGN